MFYIYIQPYFYFIFNQHDIFQLKQIVEDTLYSYSCSYVNTHKKNGT